MKGKKHGKLSLRQNIAETSTPILCEYLRVWMFGEERIDLFVQAHRHIGPFFVGGPHL